MPTELLPLQGRGWEGDGAKGRISSLPDDPIPTPTRPIANVAGATVPEKGRERVPRSGRCFAGNHLSSRAGGWLPLFAAGPRARPVERTSPPSGAGLGLTSVGFFRAETGDGGTRGPPIRLVLTDLSPQAADVCWYGLRAWIEQGFKRIQRGGWQWQYTRMDDPARAQRLWLAIALATWWWLSVGGEAEAALPVETLPTVPGAARRQNNGWRLVGIFRQGWNLIVAALLSHHMIPIAHAVPEPWPTLPPTECSIKNLHL